MQQTFNADMNISNLHQNVDPSTTLPVICGVEITTDRAGRYNLNALHRASGLGAHKAPAQWLRTLSAKQLIEELEKETMQNCIVMPCFTLPKTYFTEGAFSTALQVKPSSDLYKVPFVAGTYKA